MAERLLDFDAMTGISTFHDYDHQTKVTTISYRGDSTAVLERNKKLYNDPEYKKAGMASGLVHYASIPPAVELKWRIEDGIDIYDKNNWGPNGPIARKLNDPAYRYLRTAPGRF